MIEDTVIAGKKDFSLQQLSHNATNWPDINWNRNNELYLVHLSEFAAYTKPCLTILIVVHPVQHDLWRSIPAGRHVSRHLIICLPG